MSKLPYLDDSDSLVVNKTLASAIGLNESIVLRQLHYWIEINRKANSERHYRDGCWWTFNSYGDWTTENFPFWSTDTVRRALVELENMGLVEAGNYNTRKGDQTKWYTINYARYEAFLKHWRENNSPKVSNRAIYKEYQPVWQLAKANIATCIGQLGNLHRPLPEINSKTTTKNSPKPPKGTVKPAKYPTTFAVAKWSDELIARFSDEYAEGLTALIEACDMGEMYPTIKNMPRRDALKYMEALLELTRLGCPHGQFHSLWIYTRTVLNWRRNAISPLDMVEQYTAWRQSRETELTAPLPLGMKEIR